MKILWQGLRDWRSQTAYHKSWKSQIGKGEELICLYEIEEQDKDPAIFFEEIEDFAKLTKTSKDGIVSGVTELAYYDGSWYWRSEIIDESREKDGTWPEYVQKLPDSLSTKIEGEII